jgi:hypothetical protein
LGEEEIQLMCWLLARTGKKKKTSRGGTKGKEASKKTAKLLISQLCYNLLHHIGSENKLPHFCKLHHDVPLEPSTTRASYICRTFCIVVNEFSKPE